ncbi:S53 family peptidase [Polyangium aurulentum]|uniref:S53 family peptidase n=1 Tax=Polyangium aurulentum TaxID=2567896 RepID=UPI0010AEA6C1|nr:S53 family serine peptidase [Polyangium aurulentum]UQA60306.1 S53 family serine peptidase [Polyangium aurulentum]
MRKLAISCALLTLALGAGCGEEERPPQIGSGLPRPMEGVYLDEGPADPNAGFRALMGFPTRDVAGLESAIQAMYDPASPSFRKTMSVEDWMARHAPPAEDVDKVAAWITSQGMTVAVRGSNRLLFEFKGTVGQFNAAFQTTLHLYERENPSAGRPPIPVYGGVEPLIVPPEIAQLVTGVVTVDLPAEVKDLPKEGGDIVVAPPENVAESLTLAQISHAYDLDEMYALGHDGAGIKLGLVVGATFKFKDMQSFWQSFGVQRADPVVVQTMEPIATRYLETTLDTEWAAGLAPGAEVITYAGPDARNTSIVYTFNEAIARGEVSVLSSSFAHREETEAAIIHETFNDSARMGAALGMTIAVASGDSSMPDIPSTSPYVTCVGGTKLELGADGEVVAETAWSHSGSGRARHFPTPWYQEGVIKDADGSRAVTDVAVQASSVPGYWVYYLAKWNHYGGTSFSAPVFAAFVAVINSHRAAQGKPPVGLLNPLLYRSPEVQSAFRDVTEGKTEHFAAQPGWDYPTGWGTPDVSILAEVLP